VFAGDPPANKFVAQAKLVVVIRSIEGLAAQDGRAATRANKKHAGDAGALSVLVSDQGR
jgi:hypothetical protein